MKKSFSSISYSKFLNNENIILNLNKDDDAFKCAIQNANYLDWQNQKSYLKLLNDFNNREISMVQLSRDFETYDFLVEDIAWLFTKNLILLPSSKKFDTFSNLISDTGWCIEIYSENNIHTNELRLREIIKEISDQIEEILEPHSYPINNYQNLSELVDQLNWEIKEEYFELIEKYLQGSLDFIVVQKRYESILHIAEKLELNSISFQTNYQSRGFSNFLQILVEFFDRYQTSSEIDSKVFKYWAQKILTEIKNPY